MTVSKSCCNSKERFENVKGNITAKKLQQHWRITSEYTLSFKQKCLSVTKKSKAKAAIYNLVVLIELTEN